MADVLPLNSAQIETVIALCRQAGAAILEYYHPSVDIGLQTKSDDSPITHADLAAHQILVDGLAALDPDWPILSEESKLPPAEQRLNWRRYWLVDPLDGTKEFINGSGEFTVNVALIDAGVPVFGAVFVPCTGTLYYGGRGLGAYKTTIENAAIGASSHQQDNINAIQVRPMLNRGTSVDPVVVVASRRHGLEAVEGLIDRVRTLGEVKTQNIGSSLKLCLVAEGAADFYPRLGLTSEWDTAAAQAVVEAAGGVVLTRDFQPLRYNQKESVLNPEFYVLGDMSFDWQRVLAG